MANNYDLYLNGVVFSGTKADFTHKKLVLPSTLTIVPYANNELTIDCDSASNGLFTISSIAADIAINKLKILNPVVGGQYVIYITNTSSHILSISGRTSSPPLTVTVTVNTSTSTNVGRMNYPGAIVVNGGSNNFSNAVISFTYDGSYVYVACSAYGASN